MSIPVKGQTSTLPPANTLGLDGPSAAPEFAGSPDELPLEREFRALSDLLLPVLQQPGLTGLALELALAKKIAARDYDTTAANGETRNILSADAAYRKGVISPDTALTESGLMDLIKGRDYLAIAHGEGRDAQITVIINDSVNKNIPTALAICRNGQAPEPLIDAHLAQLTRSPHDRYLLGPLNHQSRLASEGSNALYHEAQRGSDCPLHAINAMVGKPLVSKSAFDRFIIQHRLQYFGHEGACEDDFYRNTPANSKLGHLYDLDNGIEPDVLEHVMKNLLDGCIKRFQPTKEESTEPHFRDASLLEFAEQTEQTAQGCVVYHDKHYIAFRKAPDPHTGQPTWFKLDSTSSGQPKLSPSIYLLGVLDQSPCDLINWTPQHSVPHDAPLH